MGKRNFTPGTETEERKAINKSDRDKRTVKAV